MAEHRTSLRSAGWVSLLSLGQLVVQFAFQTLLAACFGAGGEMDAFVAAISLPTFVSSVVFGSLGYALVPLLSQRLVDGDTEGAWETANNLLTILLLTTALGSLAMGLVAGPLVAALFPGYAASQAELTVTLVRVLAALVVTNALIAYSQAIHHSHHRFVTPALAPVLGALASLLIVWLAPVRSMVTVAWAVVAGSALVAALQLAWPLRQFRFLARMGPDARRLVELSIPLVLGASYYRLDPIIDRYLASGLPMGSVSHLGYASRLVTALLLVSSSGLAVVAFPSFAKEQAAARPDGLASEIAHALRCMIAIVTPIALGLLCYAIPVIHDLFERGKFARSDTHAVAVLLMLYVGMIVAAALGEVTSKAFYAISDTSTPTIVGCVGFTLGMVLKFTLISSLGITAIAFATSFYYLFNVLLMGWLISRRLGAAIFAGAAKAAARSLFASAAGVLAAAPVVFSGMVLASFAGMVVGAFAYLAVMLAQKDEFAQRLWDYIRSTRPA